MSRNVRVMKCTPEDVFAVLADGWVYPTWVVGASRMRDVEHTWPQVGAQLHHSFGIWPALVNDKTVVEQYSPPRMMVLRARGWPIGEARVAIEVKRRGEECIVQIREDAVAGPARLVPRAVRDVLLRWRNAETLHRLAYVAEGRSAVRGRMTTADREGVGENAEDRSVSDVQNGAANQSESSESPENREADEPK